MPTSTPPKITLHPVQPRDYNAIASLESAAFAHQAFSAVAFGPLRFSPAALERRARGHETAAAANKPGEEVRNVKAVLDGEEIVGFANWGFVQGRGGSEGEKGRLGTREGWVVEEEEREGKGGNGWPEGSNLKFCEDFLVKGDELMAKSTEGHDYAKLELLIVSPQYQRFGIGTKLLEDGLREADARGLQAILGASKEGLGLYLKHGFEVFEVIEAELGEYEGGEGMGVERHVIMRRPVRGVGERES